MSSNIKIKGHPHMHKIPLFCPVKSCRRITGTIDDLSLLSLGICSECKIMYVDERQKPIINLEEYAPPGGLFAGMPRAEIDKIFCEQKK